MPAAQQSAPYFEKPAAVGGVTPAGTLVAIQTDADGNVKVASSAEAGYTPVTPASTAWTLQAANTAQTLYAAGVVARGAWIANPATAAGQGIATAENAYFTLDTTTTPTTTEGGAVFALPPGQTMVLPPLTTAVRWIAATVGHKLSTWGG